MTGSFVLVSNASSMYPTMGKEPVSAGSGLGGWDAHTCGAFFACGLAVGYFEPPAMELGKE